MGSYNFSFYANDAPPYAQAKAQHRAPLYDVWNTKINIVEGTPFKITTPIEKEYVAGSKLKLTWGVDKSFFPDPKKSKVRILMSDDMGETFSHVLVPSTDNDGECEVYLPTKAMPLLPTHGIWGNDWDFVHKRLIENVFRGIWFTGAGIIRIETIAEDEDLQFYDLTDGTRNTIAAVPKRGGIVLTDCPVDIQGLPTEHYIKLPHGAAVPAAPLA